MNSRSDKLSVQHGHRIKNVLKSNHLTRFFSLSAVKTAVYKWEREKCLQTIRPYN